MNNEGGEHYCSKTNAVIWIILLFLCVGVITWKMIGFFRPSSVAVVRTLPDPKGVFVKYSVQCDYIYTGSPKTYETYEGWRFYPEAETTTNGLRVEGIFPEHAKFSFTRNNGELCTLHVPVSGSPATAMVACEGRPNRFYLSASVERKNDNIFVQAAPASSL